jgi:hypothetical protein
MADGEAQGDSVAQLLKDCYQIDYSKYISALGNQEVERILSEWCERRQTSLRTNFSLISFYARYFVDTMVGNLLLSACVGISGVLSPRNMGDLPPFRFPPAVAPLFVNPSNHVHEIFASSQMNGWRTISTTKTLTRNFASLSLMG